MGDCYQVGLYSPSVGGRVVACPPHVVTQQQAELYGLDAATRLAVRLGLSRVTVVGDNRGMNHLLLAFRSDLSNQTNVRTLRRIRNRLLWSGLLVHVVWCPSGLQPADPLSRCHIQDMASVLKASHAAHTVWGRLCDFWYCTEHMGTVQLRRPNPPSAGVGC